MNQAVFGQAAADHYDLFYSEKDYEAECDLIEQIFQRFAAEPVRSILDLGCGTGNHAIPLSQRGYKVTGVDISTEMLGHANLKAASLPHAPQFLLGDIQNMNIGRQFDAVLMMFAVLGYQLTNEEVLAALHNVRLHLKPGGLFIADVWFGPAVLAIRPSDRAKVIPTQNGTIFRIASASIDIFHQVAEVSYQIFKVSGNNLVDGTDEFHKMCYFFPQELELAFSKSGLTLHTLTAFPSLTIPADETTWNALVIAS
jgi:SAM-dependent methyltransferase